MIENRSQTLGYLLTSCLSHAIAFRFLAFNLWVFAAARWQRISRAGERRNFRGVGLLDSTNLTRAFSSLAEGYCCLIAFSRLVGRPPETILLLGPGK